jgi:hypothetical protein
VTPDPSGARAKRGTGRDVGTKCVPQLQSYGQRGASASETYRLRSERRVRQRSELVWVFWALARRKWPQRIGGA